jgi:hypothetical protein
MFEISHADLPPEGAGFHALPASLPAYLPASSIAGDCRVFAVKICCIWESEYIQGP